MPKGKRKRTQEEYDKEVLEAVKRMRKYPEHLRSARQSSTWFDFLGNIGVNPDTLESQSGQNFWGRVRGEINSQEQAMRALRQRLAEADIRRLAERGISVEYGKVYRGASGRFTSTPTDKPVAIYRDVRGRFVSPKRS